MQKLSKAAPTNYLIRSKNEYRRCLRDNAKRWHASDASCRCGDCNKEGKDLYNTDVLLEIRSKTGTQFGSLRQIHSTVYSYLLSVCNVAYSACISYSTSAIYSTLHSDMRSGGFFSNGFKKSSFIKNNDKIF